MKFANRQTNTAAHALVGKAIFLTSLIVYFNEPNCIESIIINKMI